MTLEVTSETKEKIDKLPERLSEEFADVEPSTVEKEVAEVAQDLLHDAKVEDFVPLLAHRYIRERLLEEGHEPLRADDPA
jgi:hypothetical protein